MSCTKTGCHIWIEPWHEWAYGDAFEIGPFKTNDRHIIDQINRFLNKPREGWENGLGQYVTNIAYFKIVRRSFTPINGYRVKHYTVHTFEDFGGFSDEVEKDYWPPVMLISNNFTNHGSQGVPID